MSVISTKKDFFNPFFVKSDIGKSEKTLRSSGGTWCGRDQRSAEERTTPNTYIFKGSLVQKLNSLTTESRLLGFLDILLLPLFRRFSGGGGTGVSHLNPRVFRDRGRSKRNLVLGVYLPIDPHADAPTPGNGAPPATHYAHPSMRQQVNSPVCGR